MHTLIADADTSAVRAIIHDRTGMRLAGAERDRLAPAIAARASRLGLHSTEAYARYLSVRMTQAEELDTLLADIGCYATAFFRDPAQLDHFERAILPGLIAAQSESRRLRIWCAGCATGEEAYTLAIIARRALGPELPDWRIEIVGTDISQRSLDAARTGEYRRDSLRDLDPQTRERCFEAEGALWSVRPELRAMVSFTAQSLLNRLAMRRRGPFDAIFCRDTLRFFDERARARIAANLADHLAPHATLVLSPGDAPSDSGGCTPPSISTPRTVSSGPIRSRSAHQPELCSSRDR